MSKQLHQADRIFTFVSLSAVVAATIIGFWLIGSPGKQRLLSLDEERINDLRSISDELWQQAGQGQPDQFVPLQEALPRTGPQDIYTDPKTKVPYEYRRLSDKTYELCATFALESPPEEADVYQPTPALRHPAGRHCYQFDASKSIPSALIE